MTPGIVIPCRGDIWLIDFGPKIGDEMQKQRPAVVVSSDAAGRLSLKLVVPITGWKNSFRDNFWHIRIEPDGNNGLDKVGAIDALQVQCVSVQRFIRRIGVAPATMMEDVAAAIAAVVEFV